MSSWAEDLRLVELLKRGPAVLKPIASIRCHSRTVKKERSSFDVILQKHRDPEVERLARVRDQRQKIDSINGGKVCGYDSGLLRPESSLTRSIPR
jgi:hypothetical protein